MAAPSEPAVSSRGWLSLAIPLVLLAAEIGALTLTVEYVSGPMALIAQPQVVQTAIIAGALLLLLRGTDLARMACLGSLAARFFWLIVNCGAFWLLYSLSKNLARPAASETPVSVAGILSWIALAIVVGASAVLAGASWGTLQRWSATAWHQAIGSLVLGGAVAYLTPDIQQFWHLLYFPTTKISFRLLQLCHPGQGILDASVAGHPVLGLRPNTQLRITPACAEVESLAVFLLLCMTLLIASWHTARVWRWLAATVIGLALMFFVNAIRLALLVEFGWRTDPTWSVPLAHSRASGMVFLMLGAGWLVITRRWWSPVKSSDSPVGDALSSS